MIQEEYAALHTRCQEWNEHNNVVELDKLKEQLESILDAHTTLASLPGGRGSIEVALETALAPIREQMESFKAELMRRRGGRPKRRKPLGEL
jgi:hypothetical protein